jgi:hypothetical protein
MNQDDPLDVGTEQSEPNGAVVALATREIKRALQGLLEVSDGAYSFSDTVSYTDAVWCNWCHDVILGSTDDTGCADAVGSTPGWGTPFSHVFMPADVWKRTGAGGCVDGTTGQAFTEQAVGQIIAHELGHHAFTLFDEQLESGLASITSICDGTPNPLDPTQIDCCGHSVMANRAGIRLENKVEWCTQGNHTTDRDPGVTIKRSVQDNWGHCVALMNVNRPLTPWHAPTTGTPLPTRFGGYMASDHVFVNWTYH